MHQNEKTTDRRSPRPGANDHQSDDDAAFEAWADVLLDVEAKRRDQTDAAGKKETRE